MTRPEPDEQELMPSSGCLPDEETPLPDVPAWRRDGWPRPLDSDLDEGDRLLLQAQLAMTPLQRLESMVSFVNGLDALRRSRRVRPD